MGEGRPAWRSSAKYRARTVSSTTSESLYVDSPQPVISAAMISTALIRSGHDRPGPRSHRLIESRAMSLGRSLGGRVPHCRAARGVLPLVTKPARLEQRKWTDPGWIPAARRPCWRRRASSTRAAPDRAAVSCPEVIRTGPLYPGVPWRVIFRLFRHGRQVPIGLRANGPLRRRSASGFFGECAMDCRRDDGGSPGRPLATRVCIRPFHISGAFVMTEVGGTTCHVHVLSMWRVCARFATGGPDRMVRVARRRWAGLNSAQPARRFILFLCRAWPRDGGGGGCFRGSPRNGRVPSPCVMGEDRVLNDAGG